MVENLMRHQQSPVTVEGEAADVVSSEFMRVDDLERVQIDDSQLSAVRIRDDEL